MSQKSVVKNSSRVARGSGLGFFLVVLGGVLAVLFWRSFNPAWVVFANDGPLGALMSERGRVPGVLTGSWADLNAYGYRDSGAQPAITTGLLWLLGPLGFSKFYAPLTLLFLGSCAWFLFRQLGLGSLAAVLGGLAAALCQDFFGTSCWGVGSQTLCFGLDYLALGIVVSPKPMRPWVRYPLAGMSVGMGVMEAFDVGALFSVFTAIVVFVHALIGEGALLKRFVHGLLRVVVIAVFAGFIASSVVSNLISTQIKGVAGAQEEQRSTEERWDFATSLGSMAKIETLGVIVPGVFGYGMDTPDGGAYWGKAGRHPAWDRYFASGKQGEPPRATIRYGGAGPYAGILLLIISAWAAAQSFRKERSVFPPSQRKFIWFLLGAMLVCLLLAFGRYAPFYRIFFSLPYASTVRIPAKFYHVLQWLLTILFAYGVWGLTQRYMNPAAAAPRGLAEQWKVFWTKGSAFDRKWVIGCLVAIGVALVGWLAYAGMRNNLLKYLADVQFDAGSAEAIASFSIRHVGWFVVLLTVASGLFALVLSGYFSGRRIRVGAILLGVFLAGDLVQVSRYWIVTQNWKERYLEAADNGVIQFLRQKPYEGRAVIWPFALPQQLGIIQQVYKVEWLQHLFQYYNIQSLDIIQMPRMPQDIAAFEGAMAFTPLRRWQLTNTRYLIGAAGLLPVLNGQFDPQKRFKLLIAFELYQTQTGGPILTRTNSSGPFALFEFTGALPRPKLYTSWRTSTNEPAKLQQWLTNLQQKLPKEMSSAVAGLDAADQATLKELADESFDPTQTVLLASALSAPKTNGQINSSGGTAEFVSYAPKHVVLRAKAQSPCVLVLNDKHDPNWKVIVDGKPSPLLRCNYIMRGVFLEPGEHTVEFHFEPPVNALYVSLSAIVVGAILTIVAVTDRRRKDVVESPQKAG